MADTPPTDLQDLLTHLYAAFNRRDAAAVMASLTEDVVWPNGWEGGTVKGRDQVREYWQRQWAEIDPTVEPTGFELRPDGRTAVRVHQVVRDHAGAVLSDGPVVHVYAFAGPLVSDMEIQPAG